MHYQKISTSTFSSLLFVVVFVLAMGNSIVYAKQIQPLTEELAPWQMVQDSKLVGISIDIVKEIQKRIGNDKEIKIFPWNRAYNMTLKKEGFVLFSTARSQEREDLFKWVGPLVPLQYVMYKKSSDLNIYRTLTDAKNVQAIAVTKNVISEQFLRNQGFENLQVAIGKSCEENVQRVLNGQAQLYSAGYIAGHYQIKKLHLEDKVVMTEIPPLFETSLNIAFNKNTSDDIIHLWQKTLDEIKADGTYDRIVSTYLN